MESKGDPNMPPARKITLDLSASEETSNMKVQNPGTDGNPLECHICSELITNQMIGQPEHCEHKFCLKCLIEWSKRDNTCPLDRQKFNKILLPNAKDANAEEHVDINVADNGNIGDGDNAVINAADNNEGIDDHDNEIYDDIDEVVEDINDEIDEVIEDMNDEIDEVIEDMNDEIDEMIEDMNDEIDEMIEDINDEIDEMIEDMNDDVSDESDDESDESDGESDESDDESDESDDDIEDNIAAENYGAYGGNHQINCFVWQNYNVQMIECANCYHASHQYGLRPPATVMPCYGVVYCSTCRQRLS